MNANALKWIEALESGRFVQGRNCLTNGGTDCCLGVACKIAIENGVVLDQITNPIGWVVYDNESYSLPPKVQKWLGIKAGVQHHLIRLNDTDDQSFSQIASYLRTHEKEIFTEGGPTP